MTDAPPPLAPSPPAGPRATAARARAAVEAQVRAAAAAFARTGRRGRWIAGGVSAALVTTLVAGVLVAQQGAAGAEAAPAPPIDLATVPIEPCRGAAPEEAGAGGARVTGRLDGGPILEQLRDHGLGPDALYGLRQAFEGVPGWSGATGGRFVARLRSDGKAVERFDLVVSADEAYRATVDGSGKLVGARVPGPAPRLCHANVRLGGGALASTLEATALGPDLAPALREAFAGRVDLDGRAGAELRVVAHELVVGDVPAGVVGFAVAEVRVGQDSAGDTATVRAHGSIAEAERAALDARLATIAWPEPVAPSPAAAAAEEETAVDDDDEDEPPVDPELTVAEAARRSCSTKIVAGLSRQIIEESRCIDPDAFVRVPPRKNLVASSTVFLYLEAPARDRLLEVLDAYPKVTMTVNSALRTVAQQVLLSKWGETRRCGVPLAAKPGESNHETGLALDVKEAATWRKPLEAAGFKWMGKKDPVHFDYAGPRAKDHRGLDVRAFQRLWTRNHPDDPLAETGKVDAKTAARLGKSPASGFPIGARCGG